MVQALIEARADGGFDGHMSQLFRDLDMVRSTYEPPRLTSPTTPTAAEIGAALTACAR